MTVTEMLEEIKAMKPELFGDGLSDERASALVRAVFRLVNRRLNEETNGRVSIHGFGTFRVKSVARGKGKERLSRRIVSFRRKKETDRLPE